MATKQQQLDFVKQLYPAALQLYRERDGFHPHFVVAQAALETGWKIRGINNNIFGITKGSWTGPVELCLTTEYFKTPGVQFRHPERIVNIEKINDTKYKYSVYRFFRVYESLSGCLEDHFAILKKKGYEDAYPYRHDPEEYVRRIINDTGAKYATAENYDVTLISIIRIIERHVKEIGL